MRLLASNFKFLTIALAPSGNTYAACTDKDENKAEDDTYMIGEVRGEVRDYIWVLSEVATSGRPDPGTRAVLSRFVP